MAKTKKTQPADQADHDAVSTATTFNVHLHRSPTSKVNHEAATLADAIAAYDALRSEDENRRPIIYAITPAGVSIPVPQDMIAAGRAPMFDAAEEIEDALAPLNPGDGLIGMTEAEAVEMAHADFERFGDMVPPEDDIPGFLRAGYASKNAAEAPIAEPKPAKPSKAEAPKADRKPAGKRAEVLAAAQAGTIPEAPDFSAETHTRFRKKLGEIVALVEAGNIEALKAFPINPVSSSPKAMDKYRNLAVIALEAQVAHAVN